MNLEHSTPHDGGLQYYGQPVPPSGASFPDDGPDLIPGNGTSKPMMDRHYRDLVDAEKIVAEYWNLTPESLLSKPPEVDLGIKHRVAWPDRKALKKLVWEKPMIHAAKEIGVSDVALRKHCVKLDIALPPQGHWVKR